MPWHGGPEGWYEREADLPPEIITFINSFDVNIGSWQREGGWKFSDGYYYGNHVILTYTSSTGEKIFYALRYGNGKVEKYDISGPLPKDYSIFMDIGLRIKNMDYFFGLNPYNAYVLKTIIINSYGDYSAKIEPDMNRMLVYALGSLDPDIYMGNYYQITFANFCYSLDKIPQSIDYLIQHYKDTGTKYAVVNNPNPSDRLNLRSQPDSKSNYKGKYYNGTIVEIVDYLGDWVEVKVAGSTGFMLKEYLNFEENPIKVKPEFPYLFLDTEVYNKITIYNDYTLSSSKNLKDEYMDMNLTIIGLIGKGKYNYYHVVFDNGLTGFIQDKYFTAGNG